MTLAKLYRLALTGALLTLLASGCASLPPIGDRPESLTIRDADATMFGQASTRLDPTNPASREQTTAKLFYRYSFSRDLAITASIQEILNPANTLRDDEITILGIRMRLAL